MVNVKQGCGNVVRSLLDDSMIQSLTAICKAIKVSSSFIDGKTNITEGLLANLVKGLREHYEVGYKDGLDFSIDCYVAIIDLLWQELSKTTDNNYSLCSPVFGLQCEWSVAYHPHFIARRCNS